MYYKTIFMIIAVITLILNILLTMYLLRILKRNNYNTIANKRIITFQLPQKQNPDPLSTIELNKEDETLQL